MEEFAEHENEQKEVETDEIEKVEGKAQRTRGKTAQTDGRRLRQTEGGRLCHLSLSQLHSLHIMKHFVKIL